MSGDSAAIHRPPVSAKPSGAYRIVWYLIIGIYVAGLTAGFYYWLHRGEARLSPPPAAAPAQSPTESAPAVAPQPLTVPSVASPAAAPASVALPPLDQSDRVMDEAIVRWFGARRATLFHTKDFVRRFVATVDGLGRAKVPMRVLPFKPVPGMFLVTHTGDGLAMSAENSSRYRPYVDLVAAIDAKAVVGIYSHYYAWFQDTYRMLGYPTGEFHDRLMGAIDALLDTPVPQEPVALVQPKVLYEFADPELESLSAGQKMLIRMGPENRAVVMRKLREIRRELERPRAP